MSELDRCAKAEPLVQAAREVGTQGPQQIQASEKLRDQFSNMSAADARQLISEMNACSPRSFSGGGGHRPDGSGSQYLEMRGTHQPIMELHFGPGGKPHSIATGDWHNKEKDK